MLNCGTYCCQKSQGGLESKSQPVVMWESGVRLLPRPGHGVCPLGQGCYYCVYDFTAVRVWVDVHVPHCPWGPFGCLGSGQISETMLVSEGYVATRVTLIWMACAATSSKVTPGTQVLPRVVSGWWYCCVWGLCWCPQLMFSQGS